MEVGYVNHQALTLAKDFEQTSSVSMTATMDVQGNLILGNNMKFVISIFITLIFFLQILSLLPEGFSPPFFYFILCILVYVFSIEFNHAVPHKLIELNILYLNGILLET